jgi:hypothetical protein
MDRDMTRDELNAAIRRSVEIFKGAEALDRAACSCSCDYQRGVGHSVDCQRVLASEGAWYIAKKELGLC